MHKETSDLLAEAVGRPGNEDLAPVLAEVQWLERSNAALLNFVLSGRDVLNRVQDDMKASFSAPRLAELEVEAEALRASRANVLGTGYTKEELDRIVAEGTDEEVGEVLDKMLQNLGGSVGPLV